MCKPACSTSAFFISTLPKVGSTGAVFWGPAAFVGAGVHEFEAGLLTPVVVGLERLEFELFSALDDGPARLNPRSLFCVQV